MDSSCALQFLKNKELGLAFQKSEQKAAGHLSHHRPLPDPLLSVADRKPGTEKGSDLPW